MKYSQTIIGTLTVAFATQGLCAAPTITFGPSTNYQKPPVETGKPSDDGFLITPGDLSKGVPSTGIDLFFGSGLQNTLSNTLNGVCSQSFTHDCVAALSGDINVEQAIVSRSPNLAVAGLVGSLAVYIGIWSKLQAPDNQPKKISPHIHLEPSDVALLQSQTATSVVFETAKGAPVVVVSPTLAPQPVPATATVLPADKDGHHKGDIIVSLPTQPARLLKQLIGQTGHCKPGLRFRRGNGPNLVEITNVAMFVLPNAAPHQILNGFGIQDIPQQFLRYRDEATQKAMESVQAAAAKLPEYAEVVADVTKSIASYVFAAAYSVCVDHVSTLEQIAIESSVVSEDPAGDDENNHKCPKELKNAPACDDAACSGLDSICQQDKLKGCACIESLKAYAQPGSKRDWEEGQNYLKSIVESKATDPKDSGDTGTTYVDLGNLACGKEQDMGNPNHYVSLDTMNVAIAAFCARQTLASSLDFQPGKVSDKDKHVEFSYNHHVNDPVYIAMDWIDNPGCPRTNFGSVEMSKTCEERLSLILNTCDTRNDKGLHYWKQGGTFFRDCVTWTIRRDSFTVAPTTQDDWRPPGGTCKKDKDCPKCIDPNAKGNLGDMILHGGFKDGKCSLDRDYSSQNWCTCPDGWEFMTPK